MDAQETKMLEQQRQRRKRVERIRTSLVLFMAIWAIVSLLVIVVLSVQVIKLNSRVSHMELQLTSMESASEAEDDMGEESTQQSDVVSTDAQVNLAKEGDKHQVYLTFDCTPSMNTEKILDSLERCNVKATFFMVGSDDESLIPIYKRIVKDGHTLGMNSFSNQYSTIYSSTKSFEEDYGEISDFLYDITGVKSSYYRFPGGSNNAISNVDMSEFIKILNDKNITYFDYNVSAGDDTGKCTVDSIVTNVLSGIEKYKTSIVLLHDDDSKSITAEAIEPLVKALQKKNVEILPIDDKTYVVQHIKADSVE